jgi:hypothetical protein
MIVAIRSASLGKNIWPSSIRCRLDFCYVELHETNSF